MVFVTGVFVYRLSFISPANVPCRYLLKRIATTSPTYRMRSSDKDVLEGDRLVFDPHGFISLWDGDKEVTRRDLDGQSPLEEM